MNSIIINEKETKDIKNIAFCYNDKYTSSTTTTMSINL